jgi:hypothetical protein
MRSGHDNPTYPFDRPFPARPVHSRTPRSSWELIATTTVLSDIKIAPTAGGSTIPHGASTAAASGMATML